MWSFSLDAQLFPSVGPTPHTFSKKQANKQNNKTLKHVGLPLLPLKHPTAWCQLPVTMCHGPPFAAGYPTQHISISESGFCLFYMFEAGGQSSSPECPCGPIVWSHLNRVLHLNPHHGDITELGMGSFLDLGHLGARELQDDEGLNSFRKGVCPRSKPKDRETESGA